MKMTNAAMNKRSFSRRRMNLAADLFVNGKRYRIVLRDRSINGIGIAMPSISGLEGTPVVVRSDNPALDLSGRIVWTCSDGAGIRAGISLPGKIMGSSQEWRMGEILRGLRKAARTGELLFRDQLYERKVFFQNGTIVSSTTNHPDEQMGELLSAAGKIDRTHLESAVESVYETGRQLGAVLVEQGAMTAEDLLWAVKKQAGRIISNLLQSSDGVFVFHERPLSRDESLKIPLDLTSILYENAKQDVDAGGVACCLPAAGERIRLITAEAEIVLSPLVTENDRIVIRLIDGSRTVQDVIAASPLPENETLKILLALWDTMIVEVDAAAGEETADGSAKTGSGSETALMREIEDLLREHRDLGYYGILGTSSHASAEELRHAYFERVKKWHPDRHQELPHEMREKLNTIFAFLNEAYQAVRKTPASRRSSEGKEANRPAETEDPKTMARNRFGAGMHHFRRKEFAEAATFFGQAVYIDSTVAEYHYHYGLSLIEMKKFRDAEKEIREALHLAPRQSAYAAALGTIYLQLGFRTRARNTFEKALQLDPANAAAHDGLQQCRS